MNKEYKRKTRSLSEKTKEKIRRKLTGKKKSPLHIQHIREGLIKYWKSVE